MLYLLKILLFIEVLMTIGLLLFRWALARDGRGSVSAIVPGRLYVLALLTPVVALFCGNIYLFCLYLAAAVAFSARSRPELAGTYLFLLPLTPILSVEAGVGGIYLLEVSSAFAMGLGALVGFAITGPARGAGAGARSAVTPHRHDLVLAMGKGALVGFAAKGAGAGARSAVTLHRYDFAMWGIVALFMFIYNRDPSFTGLLRTLTANVLGFVGPFLLVSRGARRAADLERLLLRLCAGGTIMAVTACFQARWHWVLFEAFYPALHVPLAGESAATALRAGMLRTGGSMVDYSSGGLFLAVVVTLMPLLRHRFSAAGFWAVTAVLVAGLVFTQSRGAWAAAIVGLVFVAACRGRWGRVLVLAGGAAAAELAVLTFARSGPLAQILGRTDEASGNAVYRQQLAAGGLDQVRAHPLLGQPPEQLVANMLDLMQGQHIVDFVNGHLFVAMAAGVPALALWSVVWMMPVAEGWWHRRAEHARLAVAPAAMVVPAMVALTFTSIVDRNLTWPLIALGLAGPCLTVSRRARSPRPRPVVPADRPLAVAS